MLCSLEAGKANSEAANQFTHLLLGDVVGQSPRYINQSKIGYLAIKAQEPMPHNNSCAWT